MSGSCLVVGTTRHDDYEGEIADYQIPIGIFKNQEEMCMKVILNHCLQKSGSSKTHEIGCLVVVW